MKELLLRFYGFKDPRIKKLVGYDIVNYQITDQQRRFILKVYPDIKEETDRVEAENLLLNHLHRKLKGRFPQPLTNTEQKFLTSFTESSRLQYARLLSFLEGNFLGDTVHTIEMFRSFGRFLAEMDLQLQHFRNYTIEARQFKWDLQHFLMNEPYLQYISDPNRTKIAAYYFLKYKEKVLPLIPSFRKQIIHGDANEWNTLTNDNRITGLIDFGDICHSPLINELAIALAYALTGKKEPVKWAIPVIMEYHKILPLEEIEVDSLYWLIAARLCTSVSNSAYERIQRPENTYIQISEKPVWELLEKWITINPLHVRNEFRKAAGFHIPDEKKADSVKRDRFRQMSSVLSVSYKQPVYLESAAFQYMFDKYGNRFLDAYNNIPHVGHSHPGVVEAGQKQMSALNTNTRYLYDQINAYTEKLLALFHGKLNKVFLVNSGSAATDLALRLARNYTGKEGIGVLEHGYHGNTQSAIEISHYKFAGKGGKGITDQVLVLPLPDTYRGEFKDENADKQYAEQAGRLIGKSVVPLAGFIAEPIVGCGGQIPLPGDYLKAVYARVREQGGVCISDEVQTGFGRMGEVFWGYELHDVIPDIVILGKPMGNGHPVGAVVTTNEIADAFNNGMEFFSSFGGNPVSCAIGQAVLDVIEKEQLQRNAKVVGNYYMERLKDLQLEHECIGDVRGHGLFIGVEFVKDRLSLTPYTELAQKVKNELRNRHILVGTDGPYDNVIKSKPPLCFSKENVDEVIQVMKEVIPS